jgi:hypothetical protein
LLVLFFLFSSSSPSPSLVIVPLRDLLSAIWSLASRLFRSHDPLQGKPPPLFSSYTR